MFRFSLFANPLPGSGARFFAVLGGMTGLGSFKSQAPSSREIPTPKPQRAALDGHYHARSLLWSLRFGASLELGVWGLELWCAPYSTENSEEPGRRMKPATSAPSVSEQTNARVANRHRSALALSEHFQSVGRRRARPHRGGKVADERLR